MARIVPGRVGETGASRKATVGHPEGNRRGVWSVFESMGDGSALALAVGVPEVEVAVVERRPRRPGRDEQVAALFDEHYAGLCRLAGVLLGDPGAAEEAVQEAFLRTYAGWWRLRHPERAGGYLRTAVVNQCRSRGRRRVVEDRGNRRVWSTDSRVPEQWGDDRVGDSLAVLAAIRGLPPRQREAIVLRYYQDLSEAEVAAAMSCSVGTVKSQLAKARGNLADALTALEGGRGGGEPARDEAGGGSDD